MATVTMTIEEYEALMDLVRNAGGGMSLMNSSPSPAEPSPKPKKRRRSKYNRELSKQLKLLKKKHPRTAVTSLMKRAHRATRKALKL
jgi:hypothetical protein